MAVASIRKSERRLDPLTPEQRSIQMSLVKAKDTTPELLVRRLIHSMGYRYRLHRRNLPGCPDLVFPAKKKAIFVHGCFWHRHKGCPRCRLPKTRRIFWQTKLDSNRRRDARNLKELAGKGWRVLVIWECQAEKSAILKGMVTTFLKDRE
jgi:DNA mismatch endonuclease (patch repair protein)